MAWCLHCSKHCDTHFDDTTSSVCCVECGKIVSQDVYAEDPTFYKDSAGGARLAGNRVKIASISESHTRTLNKGYDVINELIDKYGINDVNHATKYYQIAVERGFTRGRRTNQVAAACLYVTCRERDKPFLLIEFSSELGVSVYELGTVYFELCKVLSFQNQDFVQKPVDPSLFMHRYTSGLVKDGNHRKVRDTALHLAVSMKRDWIQTGRKPSGICAAAIYVSLLLHDYNFTKADVVKAVHICEATLTKRLIEFENTEAGSLTIEEFTQNALDYKDEMNNCKLTASNVKMPGMEQVVCKHNGDLAQSGFGLCKDCYLEFCGGLYGSEPPAFQRAQMERLPVTRDDDENETTQRETNNNKGSSTESEVSKSVKPDKISETSKEPPAAAAAADETDTLSDIDDSEVIGYLHDEEESRLKKIIWEHVNKEYVQEQAAKEAAAAAARKLYAGSSEEIREAQALAAAAAQLVATKKQKDKRKRELEAKNAKPAKTAAEAAGQHFKKKLSSKINYDVLSDLFGDEEPSQEKNAGTKEKEILNEVNDNDVELENEEDNDDETEDNEWNYDNEQQMNGYVDGDDEDY